jgi:hypothetical protein
MKQWKKLAEGAGLDIPDIERIAPALDSLEAAFRPLVRAMPYDAEPAAVFRAAAVDEVPGEQS